MKNFLSNKDKFFLNKPSLYSANLETFTEAEIVASYFLKNFNLASVKTIGDIKLLCEDANSFNLVLTLSNKKALLLKKIPEKKKEKEAIDKLTSILSWCNDKNINIPKIYPCKKGNYYINRKKNYWIMMEYIDGLFFSGKTNELINCGYETGNLMTVLSHLPKYLKPKQFKEPYFTKKEKELFLKLKNNKRNWNRLFKKDLFMKLNKNWDFLNYQWENLNKNKAIKKKYNSVIHHDLHPHNFIFANKKTYIIDFDSLIIGPEQSAIGFSLIKLLKYIHDHSLKKDFNNKYKAYYKRWITALNEKYPKMYKKEEIEAFGKAETFRRLLSMINKAFQNIPSSFNGPEVHLESLLIAEKIFKK